MGKDILSRLKTATGYLSGAQLGEELGVSRAAIWKGVKRLREEGYRIEAVNNRGYRLVVDQTLYNQVEIADAIHTKCLGRPVFFYDITDSTNLCIRRLAMEGLEEGTLAVAEEQSAGRGRLGRQWISVPGTGIFMSLLLRPKIRTMDAPVLTLLVGIAVCLGIRKETGLFAQIKWPNDVLVNGKKVCGILTEMDGEMECVRSVTVGIGINVNTMDFPEELREVATSLKKEGKSKADYPRIPLIACIMAELEGRYMDFQQAGDFLPFLSEYKELSHTLGKDVEIMGRCPFFGRAIDITPTGELVVEKENGEQRVVCSGEISIRAFGG